MVIGLSDLLPAKLDSSLWRRMSSSKLCSLVAHHTAAAEQRWLPAAHNKPKATWTSLACEDRDVRRVSSHPAAHRSPIMCAGHTQMATAAPLAHGSSSRCRTAALRQDQTMAGTAAEQVSTRALQAPPDIECLLLPFLDGDLHCSAGRVFSKLGSRRLLLPLQFSSGSVCAHLPQLYWGQAWREDVPDVCSCLTRSPQIRGTTGDWQRWNKHRQKWVEPGTNSPNRLLG